MGFYGSVLNFNPLKNSLIFKIRHLGGELRVYLGAKGKISQRKKQGGYLGGLLLLGAKINLTLRPHFDLAKSGGLDKKFFCL